MTEKERSGIEVSRLKSQRENVPILSAEPVTEKKRSEIEVPRIKSQRGSVAFYFIIDKIGKTVVILSHVA